MGSSSSKSASTTTYSNTDKRGVADNGAFLVTGDGNALDVRVESVDADIAKAAFAAVTAADAAGAEGFGQLLDLAGELFAGAGQMVEGTQAAALNAYSNATTEKAGTIDNKTIIVLGVAAAVALIAVKGRG